ncbi:F-box/kelch-repeat protein At3g23880-like [Quercus robur]|uniref:F-box/kelch-repeat protein At3g23880-like n=1 Tax=Quercus robur TaxID=38942 RepID=UPI002163D424|nr:F-box/kelch-repeat protein At3g23880-like [Quercus robur]
MLSCDLPEDLVVEILSSLPVKSLMRFKCVCKSWHALIRNHSFITQHHKWATSNNQGCGVVFKYLFRQRHTFVSLLSDDTLEVSSNIDISPFFPEEIDMLVIDGPCNGIFFLYGISSERYYGEEIVLWNPATRESKVLPIIKQRPQYSSPYVTFNFGFGIDPKKNDLKVVRIVDFWQRKPLQFEVYNLSTDSWRVIDGSVNQLYGFEFAKFPSYLNGFYHWKASRFMISFDMSNEVFQETPLPPIIEDPFSTNAIAIINDSVSLIVQYFDVDISWYDVWVMSETGVERTWTKKFKISPHPDFDRMLEFREDGLVLFQYSDGWLVVYDRKTQEVRNIAKYEISDLSHSFAVSYTETLVFLNVGNVIE